MSAFTITAFAEKTPACKETRFQLELHSSGTFISSWNRDLTCLHRGGAAPPLLLKELVIWSSQWLLTQIKPG